MVIGIVLVCALSLLNCQLTVSLYLMDLMELVRECSYLIQQCVICVDRVVSIVRVEGGHAYAGVMVVIVGELHGVEIVGPIVLLIS
jgi:hypothetical protein